mgnify:CR=1 FL=1
MKKFLFPLIAVTFSLAAAEKTVNWPQWRGPDGNNISKETDWTDEWTDGKPNELWRANVQLGFGSMVVGENRLFTLGHDGDSTVTLSCLDANSGKQVWKKSWASDLGDKYFEGGPVSTPVLDGRHLYVLGRWGTVFCLQAANGKVIWQRDLVEEEGVRVPTWGFAGAPVIHGEHVLLNVGESGMVQSGCGHRLVEVRDSEAAMHGANEEGVLDAVDEEHRLPLSGGIGPLDELLAEALEGVPVPGRRRRLHADLFEGVQVDLTVVRVCGYG